MADVDEKMTEFTVGKRDASPAHLLIRIESFSMLSKYGIRKYESREFDAGDCKWRLIIYPDGRESAKEGDHVAVYLSMVGTTSLPVDWEVNAIFNILLLNQDLGNYLCFQGKVRCFDALNSKWGFSKLISKKTLTDPSNGYLVDDSCVFGAEVFVSKRKRVMECVSVLEVQAPCKRAWKILQFSKLEGAWTSEEIVAGGHQWKIELNPDDSTGGEHCVSIFLECVDAKSFAPHEKVKADCCVHIKNKRLHADRSMKLSEWYTSSSKSWGCDVISVTNMCDRTNGFLVDDCCVLEVEISVQVVVRDAPKLE